MRPYGFLRKAPGAHLAYTRAQDANDGTASNPQGRGGCSLQLTSNSRTGARRKYPLDLVQRARKRLERASNDKMNTARLKIDGARDGHRQRQAQDGIESKSRRIQLRVFFVFLYFRLPSLGMMSLVV